MRTKILLFPLLLLVIIITLIWVIIPRWNEITLKRADLAKREKQLAEVQTKNGNVDSLISIFNQEKESRDILYSFVPTKVNDEDILSNLIYYANMQSGENFLTVSDIAISNPTKEKKDVKAVSQIDEIAGMDPEAEPGSILAIGSPLTKPVSFNTAVSFTGKYSGLKEFFTKLGKLTRSSIIKSFDISRDAANKDASPRLNAKVTVAFGYLDEYKPENVDGAALEDNLNVEVAKKIKASQSANFIRVEANPARRENPFLP